MKKLICVGVIAALLTGCTAIESTRQKIAAMPEADYQRLVADVKGAATIGGQHLGLVLEERKTLALSITQNLRKIILEDRLDVDDVVQGVLKEYAAKLGLTAQELSRVRDAAAIIDVAVGQIRLGVTGDLSLREKGLILALLDGVEAGLKQ